MRYLLLFVCWTCWACLGQMPMDGTYNLTQTQTAASSLAAGYYALWDADTLSGANGTPVTNWVDAVASRSLIGPSVSPCLLTNSTLNGHSIVWFVANSGLSYAGLPRGDWNTSVFVVASSASPPSYALLFGGTNAEYYYWGENADYTPRLYDGSLLTSAAVMPQNTYMIWEGVMNGASSGLYTNGVAVVEGDAGTANSLAGICIGGVNDGTTFPWKGGVAYVLVYTNTLSGPDTAANITYLKSRFGL